MCRPITKKSTEFDSAQKTLKDGILYSCISLSLLITGLSLTFPHFQSRRDELGCDALCYGSMTSVRSALSLIGTAAIGRLSDCNDSILARVLGAVGNGSAPSGRRACLYIGIFATLASLTFAITINSLHGLWISMVPSALLSHNFEVFKALISEYCNDAELSTETSSKKTETIKSGERSGAVGKLGMVVGISFMIGPMIAAIFSPSFQVSSQIAIIFTVLSGLVIMLKLPLPAQIQGDKVDAGKLDTSKPQTEFTLMKMMSLSTPKARAAVSLLVTRLLMALAFHIFATIWPQSLKNRFAFGPTDHARFMSFVGLTYAFSQGVLAKSVVQFCGNERKVLGMMSCCLILGAGRYIAYYTTSLVTVYSSFFFIINALGVMNTILTADSGAIAPREELGSLFGLLQAGESAAGMVGPFLGGLLSHTYGAQAPLMGVVFVYAFLGVFLSSVYEKAVLSAQRDTKKEM